MPQDTKTHGHDPFKLEGASFRPSTFAELVDAIDHAFDYRGDVTIETKDGRRLEGYIFNRERDIAEPYLQMFPRGQAGQLMIRYQDIAALSFTGEDTAFGKSWDAWAKKNEAQRKAEAGKLAAEAAARGHL